MRTTHSRSRYQNCQLYCTWFRHRLL